MKRRNAGLAFVLWAAGAGLASAQAPVQLHIDMTDAARKLLHVTEVLPAQAGMNTFEYPQWIQGAHMPVGPIDNVTGVVFHQGTVDGPVLPWRRDLVDMYAFHVDAPQGTTAIAVTFDQLAVKSRFDTDSPEHYSSHVGMLEVSDAILYPAGVPVRQIPVAATVHLPQGWQMASALRVARDDTSRLQPSDTTFTPVSVEQLIDSPIVFGEHCRQYPLAPEVTPAHTLDVCADDPKELELKPELLRSMNGLVRQSTATFKSHHYRHFDFVVAVSQHLSGDSLEHTESADYIVRTLDVSDPDVATSLAYLLPHEYMHSWCGKYRRPIGLATPDYHVPMQDDLLWGYEGLTQYYGIVMAVRAGFATPGSGVNGLSMQAAYVDRPGRLWRPLQDTADASSILRSSDPAWGNLRLNQDYYSEGALVWLEADVKMRQMSHGTRSLDDFAAQFLGAKADGGTGDTGPGVFPYRFNDVVTAMNAVVPYDWAGFWTERLTRLTAKPPVAGLEAAGYSHGLSSTPDAEEAKQQSTARMAKLHHSIGFAAWPDGVLRDVWLGSPAFKAGLGPGDKLVQVNGKPYTVELLVDAVNGSSAPGSTLQVLAERNGEKTAYTLDWHGGGRYAVLQRNANADMLTGAILLPRQ